MATFDVVNNKRQDQIHLKPFNDRHHEFTKVADCGRLRCQFYRPSPKRVNCANMSAPHRMPG